MKRVRPTGTFKKDLKRAAKRGWNLRRLYKIIIRLQDGVSLPLAARPHRLSGEWEGCWECHIEHDWLLIYELAAAEVILVRTGTHTDLFE